MIAQDQPQINPQLPTVRFCRRQRVYIVANGREIERFPAGPDNRIKAEWAAIAYASPLTHQAARALAGELASVQGAGGRVLKAAWIAVKGDVQGGTVRSQSTPGKLYRVEERSLIGLYCPCDDYQLGREARFYERPHAAPTAGGQTLCKHVLARLIVERAAELAKVGNSEVARLERAQALPASVDRPGSIEDLLG